MTADGAVPVAAPEKPVVATRPHAVFDFLLTFGGIFAALAMPSPGVGPLYVKAHAALGNALASWPLPSGVQLSFEASARQLLQHPWQLTLLIQPPMPQAALNMPIDLRSLAFLPTATFVALTVATPLGSWKSNARMLGVGLLFLVPLIGGLLSLPILSFLGGTGPVRAFSLGLWSHVLLQVCYRALVAPPGMTFAVPLLVWWLLLRRFRSYCAKPSLA